MALLLLASDCVCRGCRADSSRSPSAQANQPRQRQRRAAAARLLRGCAPPASGPTWNFWPLTHCAAGAAAQRTNWWRPPTWRRNCERTELLPPATTVVIIQRATLLQPKFTGASATHVCETRRRRRKNDLELRQGIRCRFICRRLTSQARCDVINADEDDPQAAGAIVLILGNDRRQQRAKASSLARKGSGCRDPYRQRENAPPSSSNEPRNCPRLPVKIEGEDDSGLLPDFNVLEVSPEAAKILGSASRKHDAELSTALRPAKRNTPGMRSASCAAVIRSCATHGGVALRPSRSPGDRSSR